MKSLLSFFKISTFSLLFYWNLHFLFTFLLKPLLSLDFSSEISTFSLLFYWNLSTFSSFSLLFYWDLYPHLHQHCAAIGLSCLASPNVTTHHMCACTTFAPSLHGEKQSCPSSNYAHKKFKEKLCPACHAARRRNRAETVLHTASHTTSFRDPLHLDLLWKHRVSHASLLSFQTCTFSHACHTYCNLLTWLDWATSWPSYSIGWATSWPSCPIVSCLLVTLPALFNGEFPLDYSTTWLIEWFNCELPLDYSTSWLSYPIVRNCGSF